MQTLLDLYPEFKALNETLFSYKEKECGAYIVLPNYNNDTHYVENVGLYLINIPNFYQQLKVIQGDYPLGVNQKIDSKEVVFNTTACFASATKVLCKVDYNPEKNYNINSGVLSKQIAKAITMEILEKGLVALNQTAVEIEPTDDEIVKYSIFCQQFYNEQRNYSTT